MPPYIGDTINSFSPGQNGRHFADDIFVNEKFCILIKISLRFVPKGPIDNNPAFGLDNGLAPTRRQAIIWTNVEPIYWHINAARWGDELRNCPKLGTMLHNNQYMSNKIMHRAHMITSAK